MVNKNLNSARSVKNDEFYTQYKDIEKEISAYVSYNPDVFKGKTVLCPCDNPYKSNFAKYFTDNFLVFGLKKLICTCIAPEAVNKSSDGLYTPSLLDEESDESDELNETDSNSSVSIMKTNGLIYILNNPL